MGEGIFPGGSDVGLKEADRLETVDFITSTGAGTRSFINPVQSRARSAGLLPSPNPDMKDTFLR